MIDDISDPGSWAREIKRQGTHGPKFCAINCICLACGHEYLIPPPSVLEPAPPPCPSCDFAYAERELLDKQLRHWRLFPENSPEEGTNILCTELAVRRWTTLLSSYDYRNWIYRELTDG